MRKRKTDGGKEKERLDVETGVHKEEVYGRWMDTWMEEGKERESDREKHRGKKREG